MIFDCVAARRGYKRKTPVRQLLNGFARKGPVFTLVAEENSLFHTLISNCLGSAGSFIASGPVPVEDLQISTISVTLLKLSVRLLILS